MKSITSFETILASIKNNNGMVIDDHRSDVKTDAEKSRKVHAIGKFGERTVFLCSAEETDYFCLNSMYVDENNKPHLSRNSIGGVIKTERGLEAGIADYNDPANWLPGHRLVPVTEVVYL